MAYPARLARVPTTVARRVTFSFFKVFSCGKGFTDLHPGLCEAGLTSGAIQRRPAEISTTPIARSEIQAFTNELDVNHVT